MDEEISMSLDLPTILRIKMNGMSVEGKG